MNSDGRNLKNSANWVWKKHFGKSKSSVSTDRHSTINKKSPCQEATNSRDAKQARSLLDLALLRRDWQDCTRRQMGKPLQNQNAQ
jgi:hypothetical protein